MNPAPPDSTPRRMASALSNFACHKLKLRGMVDTTLRPQPERARAQSAPPLRTLRRQDPCARIRLGARQRLARLHRRRQVHQPRLDRVDAGLPVRRRDPAVRRHRRHRVPRDRPQPHRRRDGPARQPHRRPRSRLQQRQHLRQSAAPHGRRPHPGEPVGAPLLRDGAQGLRRRAGRALVAHRRWRRLHLQLQRPAFSLRGHHPHPARPRREPPARPRPDGRER